VSGMEEARNEHAEKGQNEGGCTHVYRSLCSYTGMFSHEIDVVLPPLKVVHLNDICAAAMDGRCGQCMKARRSIPFSRVQYVVPCG
jgi:hypothetical protein